MLVSRVMYLAAVAIAGRQSAAFNTKLAVATCSRSRTIARPIPSTKLCMSTVSNEGIEQGVSRLSILRTLLSRSGAPGSKGCSKGDGDLVPVDGMSAETLNLHPHLFPLAKSTSSNNFVCALKRAYADDVPEYESSTNAPLPIVEAKLGGPGMKLLALNSEHLMRRIAATADDGGRTPDDDETIAIYNDGLGEGKLSDGGLDTPYQVGSVEQLGYGLEKFALLRIGPFPDLYESMALQHQSKGDEQSSLIAAEASNGKFTGFGSTFAFYAKLLSTFPQRKEEARDAARMCLRLPIPSNGLDEEEFVEIARLADIADDGDSAADAMAKMLKFYEKIREHEKEDDQNQGSMTPEQAAIDEANYLLDKTALTGGQWESIREELGRIYETAGREDMTKYCNPDL
mmetsp:Transcript_26950/g.58425  ORF Transcript_26950/g.58425 Transcript_26950/m.58425 type:complete len:400 (-) Transcript_26950:1438-2637(-)